MNPRNGNAAAGPSRRRGTQSRKHAREDVGASGSGNGSETEANFPFRGVSCPSSAVEIKNYLGLLTFYRRVTGPSRGEAAMVYDLAQCYRDPNFPEEMLNIRAVVRFKMEENIALAKPQDLDIGKEFYVFFVLKHPLKIPHEQWKKENFAAVRDEIVAKASECLRALEEEIARKCRVRGRQRTDLAEILPSLPEDDLKQCLDDLKDQNQDLKVENQDLKVETQDLKVENRDLKVENAILEELLQQALALSQPEVSPKGDHLSPGEWWEKVGWLDCLEPNEEQFYSGMPQWSSNPHPFG